MTRPWPVLLACTMAWLVSGMGVIVLGVAGLALWATDTRPGSDAGPEGLGDLIELLQVVAAVGFGYSLVMLVATFATFWGRRGGRWVLLVMVGAGALLGGCGLTHDPASAWLWSSTAYAAGILALLYLRSSRLFFAGGADAAPASASGFAPGSA